MDKMDNCEMNEYLISWTIDIAAETPLEAAQEALGIQRDLESTATIFECTDEHGVKHEIDVGYVAPEDTVSADIEERLSILERNILKAFDQLGDMAEPLMRLYPALMESAGLEDVNTQLVLQPQPAVTLYVNHYKDDLFMVVVASGEEAENMNTQILDIDGIQNKFQISKKMRKQLLSLNQ